MAREEGAHFGRPVKYTQQFIEEEAEALLKWMKVRENIWLNDFALDRDYHPKRLSEFAKMNEYFSLVLEKAKKRQESKLLNLGLWNKTNFNMTKMILVNHHNWQSGDQRPEDKKQDTGMIDKIHEDLQALKNVPAQPETNTQL